MLDRLPVPFGLVRYGVAPDHPSIRSIRNTLERTLEKSGVRFFGDVTIGRDLTVEELRERVDAVIYAFGAGTDKRLGIPGEDLPGQHRRPGLRGLVLRPPRRPPRHRPGRSRSATSIDSSPISSPGPPSAVVVGVGNVALDVTRILIKNVDQLADTDMADEVLEALTAKRVTDVHVLGRRGPAYTAFTTKELRELGQIAGVDVIVDPADLELDPSSEAVVGRDKVAARNLAVLQDFAGREPGRRRSADLPALLDPTDPDPRRRTGSRPSRSSVRRSNADGLVEGTGLAATIAAQLIVRSVGYRGRAAGRRALTTTRPAGCRTRRAG